LSGFQEIQRVPEVYPKNDNSTRGPTTRRHFEESNRPKQAAQHPWQESQEEMEDVDELYQDRIENIVPSPNHRDQYIQSEMVELARELKMKNQ